MSKSKSSKTAKNATEALIRKLVRAGHELASAAENFLENGDEPDDDGFCASDAIELTVENWQMVVEGMALPGSDEDAPAEVLTLTIAEIIDLATFAGVAVSVQNPASFDMDAEITIGIAPSAGGEHNYVAFCTDCLEEGFVPLGSSPEGGV